MIVCPQCQFENPNTNKFCQNCGLSLTQKSCPECGTLVSLAALNCPSCGTRTGQVWLAVISHRINEQQQASMEQPSDWTEILAPDHLGGASTTSSDSTPAAGDVLQSQASPLEINTSPEAPEPDPNAQTNDSDLNFTLDPHLDSPATFSEEIFSREDLQAFTLPASDALAGEQLVKPATETLTKLPLSDNADVDAQHRYQLLEGNLAFAVGCRTPIAAGQTVMAEVLDCEPLQVSPLSVLQHHQDTTGNPSLIAAEAQPYISLKSQHPQHFPILHDAWETPLYTVVLLENYSHLPRLTEQWSGTETSSLQIIRWLEEMTALWVALEPWQCRQSLLEVNNLHVAATEPFYLRLQRLIPDPTDPELGLSDLGKFWKSLFQQSQRTLFGSITELLRDLKDGQINSIEDLQHALIEIKHEIISTNPSTPLQADGLSPHPFPKSPVLLDLEAVGRTDIGRQRDHNEDFFGLDTDLSRRETPTECRVRGKGLYILCDGMGGHAGGEVASQLAVETLQDYFRTYWRQDQLPNAEQIREGIITANNVIYQVNQQGVRSGSGRMGTTLVLAMLADTQVAVAHVGDSRFYRFSLLRGLEQITQDHEVGQREMQRGFSPEVAYRRPDAHQLTQALGPRDQQFVHPDVHFLDIDEDMLLILASDGLTDHDLLEAHGLTHLEPLLDPQLSLEKGVQDLITLANEYNGHDNITAVVIRVRVEPR